MRFRYGIRFLLAMTALAAVTLGIFRYFDWQTRGLLVIAGLWTASGFVAGWTARHSCQNRLGSYLSASAFIGFNWLLWYLNWYALWFSQKASADLRLVGVLERMIEAQQIRIFDSVAVIFSGLIAVAAWLGSDKSLFRCGAACLLTWFLVVSTGYVMAAASLWQLD